MRKRRPGVDEESLARLWTKFLRMCAEFEELAYGEYHYKAQKSHYASGSARGFR